MNDLLDAVSFMTSVTSEGLDDKWLGKKLQEQISLVLNSI